MLPQTTSIWQRDSQPNASGRPGAVHYDADAIRADLAKRNMEAVIPDRSNLRLKIEHERALYKQPNRIERMFGQLKINRAIATRYPIRLTGQQLSEWSISPPPKNWLKFVHAA